MINKFGFIIKKDSYDNGLKNAEVEKFSRNFLAFLCFSVFLHSCVLYFFLFGLPSMFEKLPEEQIIVFEVLPVSEKSNIITHKKSEKSFVQNEDAKKTEQNKLDTVKKESELSNDKQLLKEHKTVEKKELVTDQNSVPPLPKEKKIVTKKEETPKIKDKKQEAEIKDIKPKKKQEVKQEEIKKEKVKKNKQNDKELDSLLKNLEQSSEGDNTKSNKVKRNIHLDNKEEAKGNYNKDLPLSVSEAALIKRQIERHWSNIPAGARNNEKVRIVINIKLDKEANVEAVNVIEKVCLNIEYGVCEALADSAMRAIWQASPIENLDPSRFNYWKEININFDPSKL